MCEKITHNPFTGDVWLYAALISKGDATPDQDDEKTLMHLIKSKQTIM